MQTKTLALRILPLAVLLGAFNQLCAQPNFSGEWKMNPAKSNFAPLPQPDKMVRKIAQRSLVVGLLFGAAAVWLAVARPGEFYRAYLLGFMLWLGVALGSMAILMIRHLTGGGW